MKISKGQNISGMKFSRLLVLEYSHNKGHYRIWKCLCDCGNITYVSTNALNSGHTKSCSCLQKEKLILAITKHGLTKLGQESPLYSIWENVKQRCLNKKCIHYKYYGGRGITICQEWESNFKAFHDWALNNGWVSGLTLERIDVDGNYEPSNCTWITLSKQQYNKRTSSRILHKGEVITLKALYDSVEGIVPFPTFTNRFLKLGWSAKQAATAPIKPYRKKR